MPREYKDFDSLRYRADEMFRAYNLIGWENLNADGCVEYRAWDTIVESFAFAETKADIVEFIRGEIAELKAKIQSIPAEDLMNGDWREDVAVIQLLRKYIRFNCERDLWKDIPEFKSPTT